MRCSRPPTTRSSSRKKADTDWANAAVQQSNWLRDTSKESLCVICLNLPPTAKAMLQAIGARSIDDLFAPIPAEYRLDRDLKVPRQMAESEIVDWFRERSRENGDSYATFPRRRSLFSLPAGDHRFAHFARRVFDCLHTLSGGDFAGHTAGNLRVPDHDLRTDGHGSRERFHVRRFHRSRRSA